MFWYTLFRVVKAIHLLETPADPRGYSCIVSHGIKVIGTKEFLAQTEKALALLRASSFFPDIISCIGVIKEHKRSGIFVFGRQPVFEVGEATWRRSVLWYALAIAHETRHVQLYREGRAKHWLHVPRKTFGGREAERKCIAYEIDVLNELVTVGHAEYQKVGGLIRSLRRQMDNPTHQGDNTWRDYKDRWW